jgi:hypothetical protein
MISKMTPERLAQPTPSESAWIEKNIPFLGGRPEREAAIGTDDIMNLLIASNTCSTFEEFFNLT